MNDAALLDEKIKYFRQELTNLKTAHVKTATTISTMEALGTVNFALTLDTLSGQVYSTQRAIITLNSANSTNFVSACYLDGATPTNLDNRLVFVERLDSGSAQCRFGVVVFSMNYNDYVTLSGGGSVNLSYNIKLVGSSKFSTSISYKAIDGGSS